ncbi:MAG: RNA-binding protein [bacterium]
MNIYVGNMSPKTTEWQLRREFDRYGKVGKISMDKHSNDENAYSSCFVEMPFDTQATVAIRELNGKILSGFTLNIKESGVSL